MSPLCFPNHCLLAANVVIATGPVQGVPGRALDGCAEPLLSASQQRKRQSGVWATILAKVDDPLPIIDR